ncbi:hypothetical protein NSPZN2_10189 [Nitrospira defluvii]|uniref:Transposase n=1 Tax=Nitrospira defluvii TaxID=330214 RepID=A0ABM8QCU8_9BACT|nr:hypothetical protein NSPZN2_10189 [Nitrospira defluvii]
MMQKRHGNRIVNHRSPIDPISGDRVMTKEAHHEQLQARIRAVDPVVRILSGDEPAARTRRCPTVVDRRDQRLAQLLQNQLSGRELGAV